MAARDDILRELHLLPRWTLRARPGLGARADAPAASPTAAPHAPIPAASRAPTAASVPRAAAPAASSAPAPASAPCPADADARSARIAALQWPDFAADVAACTACSLCRTRRKTVPGVGATPAEWLFVGEAPGSEEDARGEPFVGQAGRLLDNMLAALGLARGAGVYIANVLKCRPPGNRTPEPLEVAACVPYLDRQIELLRPRLIVALGKSAATTLLDVDATIASLRGRVHRYRDVPLVVTYHPAYLLRNLPDKAKAWEDLLLARRTMAALRDAAGPAPADVQ
jgi:uracil-DNA glycosylase family 4